MIPTSRSFVAAWLILSGCAKPVTPAAPVPAPIAQIVSRDTPEIAGLLTALERRAPAARVRARFAIRMRSEPMRLAASTGGGVLLDRPGKGYLAILGPIGNPIVTLAADGVGVAMTDRTHDRFLLEPDAETGLQRLTNGALRLDDLWGVIVADLPVAGRTPAAVRRTGPLVDFDYAAGTDGVVRVTADLRTHLPHALAILRGDEELGRVTWTEFAPAAGAPMPGKAIIEVHKVALRVELDFKTWEALDEAPEGLMTVTPPEGFEVLPFSEGFEQMRGLELPSE